MNKGTCVYNFFISLIKCAFNFQIIGFLTSPPFSELDSILEHLVYFAYFVNLKQCRSNSDKLESDNASTASGNFEFPIDQTDEGVESDYEPSPELQRLIEQEAKEIQPHKEATDLINLGTEEEKKEDKVSMFMKDEERVKLMKLLHDYSVVFSWSYQDIPGLDTSIMEHKLPLKPECPQFKQNLR